MCDVPKQTLVLVHGYLGGGSQWAQQREALSENFLVITPSLPGYGHNMCMESPHTIQEYAEHVIAVLDSEHIEHFMLLGHSMGGMIAQEIAVRIPTRVKSLVLYATGAVGTMPGRFESIAESQRILLRDGAMCNAGRICSKWFIGGTASHHYSECAAIAEQTSAQAAYAGLSAMQNWSGEGNLSEIKTPTLILWGDKDQSYTVTSTLVLYRGICNSILRVIPGGSHAIHLENPDTFNKIVTEFLLQTRTPARRSA